MKNNTLWILALALASCKDDVKFEYTKISDGALVRTDIKVGKASGRSIVYNSKGIIKNIFHIKNGILDGDAYSFYDNGKLAEIMPYHDGYVKGEYYEFYNNGMLKLRVNMVDGKKMGEAIGFYPNGRVSYITSYQSNRIFGNYLLFHNTRNIKIKRKSVFINVGGKEWNNQSVSYDTTGHVVQASGLISKTFDKDIYKLGDNLTMSITVKNPDFKLSKLVVGNFDSSFINKNTDYQHIAYGLNHTVKISLPVIHQGINIIRGYVSDYDSVVSRKRPISYQIKESVIYFQSQYKVTE